MAKHANYDAKLRGTLQTNWGNCTMRQCISQTHGTGTFCLLIEGKGVSHSTSGYYWCVRTILNIFHCRPVLRWHEYDRLILDTQHVTRKVIKRSEYLISPCFKLETKRPSSALREKKTLEVQSVFVLQVAVLRCIPRFSALHNASSQGRPQSEKGFTQHEVESKSSATKICDIRYPKAILKSFHTHHKISESSNFNTSKMSGHALDSSRSTIISV